MPSSINSLVLAPELGGCFSVGVAALSELDGCFSVGVAALSELRLLLFAGETTVPVAKVYVGELSCGCDSMTCCPKATSDSSS
jgi:hypothetical protein